MESDYLGPTIQKIRLAEGLTKFELSARLHKIGCELNQDQIHLIEEGMIIPTIDQMAHVAFALRIPQTGLLLEVERMEQLARDIDEV